MKKDKINNNFFLKKSILLFSEFIKNNDKFKALAYFRRTPAGWLIILKIMESYYAHIDIHVEELIKEIPNKIASRLTIFSLINDATKKGFMIKKESPGDKRKKIIKPSETFIKEYSEWLYTFVNNAAA